MIHVMLDLETLDSGPRAAVVAIGACVFDPYTFLPIPKEGRKTFYLTIDPQSAIDAGGTVSGHTIKWWMEQSDAARQQTFGRSGWKLVDALLQFNAWLAELASDYKKIAVWGNGATFDNVVLRSAYTSLGLTPHWHFRGDKCYRTLVNEVPENLRPPFLRIGTLHNALDDALTQADYLQKCLYMLGLHRHLDAAGVEHVARYEPAGKVAFYPGMSDTEK